MSTGCVAACPPAELEGVLAHEIAHVRLHDVQVQTAAAVAAAVLLETSRIGGWLERALLFVLGPSRRRASTCSSRRSASSRPTGSPRSSATRRTASPTRCMRLEQAAELVEFEGSPATEPLFTINPFAERGLGGAVRHAPAGRGAGAPAARARSRLARQRRSEAAA